MTKETGGPAFPRPASEAHQHGMHSPQEGISMRDYFAAKAMQSLITVQFQTKQPQSVETAYEWADAMLEARK